MDRTGISFDILLQAQIARSSSSAAQCTPNNQYYWTVLNWLWSRFLRELGLIRHITPVINVAANSSCNAERPLGVSFKVSPRGGLC